MVVLVLSAGEMLHQHKQTNKQDGDRLCSAIKEQAILNKHDRFFLQDEIPEILKSL